jgi:hypothetical protein
MNFSPPVRVWTVGGPNPCGRREFRAIPASCLLQRREGSVKSGVHRGVTVTRPATETAMFLEETEPMVRKLIRASLFAALGSMAMILSFGAVTTAQDKKGDKKDEKLPDISEIMAKAHGKTDGYIAQISTAAKGAKWDDAAKTGKDFTLIADALAKNKPPKGDAKSWETLTKKYIAGVKTVNDAIEKKDAKAVMAAFDRKTGVVCASCGACHAAHKPK